MATFTHPVSGATVRVDQGKAARMVAQGWLQTSTSADGPDESWKVADLKSYAADRGIDLGTAKGKSEMVAAIAAASDE